MDADFSARACLGVGKRFTKTRAAIQFAGFQNLAAVETFDVLRIVIFGDQARSGMLAAVFRHSTLSTNLVDCSITGNPAE